MLGPAWTGRIPRLRIFMLKRLTCCRVFKYDPKAILDSSGWHAESAKHKCQASSISMKIHLSRCFTNRDRCFKSWPMFQISRTIPAGCPFAWWCQSLRWPCKRQEKSGTRHPFFFSDIFRSCESCPCVVAWQVVFRLRGALRSTKWLNFEEFGGVETIIPKDWICVSFYGQGLWRASGWSQFWKTIGQHWTL